MIHVTGHAICRFQERVANVTDAEVIAFLTSPTFLIAAAFRAPSVILGTGQRVIFAHTEEGAVIVTVKPPKSYRGAMDPRRAKASNRNYTPRQAPHNVLYGKEAHCGARHRGSAW